MKARRSVIIVGIVLALAAGVRAQDLFYDAYNRGVKAFDAGNLPLARQMFERALQLDSRQSREKRYLSMNFMVYLPEYYLGRISVKEGQYDKAIAYFSRLQSAGLIKQGDKEYATLTAERAVAERAVADRTAAEKTAADRTAAEKAAADRAAARTTADKAAADKAAADKAAADKAVADKAAADRAAATRAAADKAAADKAAADKTAPDRAAAARTAAEKAAADRAAADKALADKVAADKLAADKAATRTAAEKIAPDKAAPDLAQVRLERETLKDLLLGDYRKVVDATAPVVDTTRASARLMFYAACGRAALSLTAPANARAGLVTEARRLFDRASQLGTSFSRDQAYISPEILGILQKR